MNNSFKIVGLDCANCARELEEEIEKVKGVNSVSVDFMGLKVTVDCDEDTLVKVKDVCNHFEEVKVVESGEEPAKESENKPEQAQSGKKIKIANLCCANCGRELEEELNKIDGVSATVDFMNMTVVLTANSTKAYDEAVYAITHFEDVKIVDDKPEKKSVFKENLKQFIMISVAVVFFAAGLLMADILHVNYAVKVTGWVFYCIAFVVAGFPVFVNTVKNLAKGRIFDENFLMALASSGAIALGIVTGDGYMEGAAVMILYQIGEYLQSIAVGSSRRSIATLMDLKSQTATLITGENEYVVVAPEDLRKGQRILIKAGEKVPVDCRICKGETSLDMKSLNGEAIPRDVKLGDEILSGSINVSGVIEAEVLREYKDSAVAKILELVENSTAKKAKSEKFITKFAKYYTPAVVIAAVLVAALVPTIICAVSGAYTWEIYSDWIYKSLSFLVISCPCALVISVPLSYFGGIGRCAKFGILVKGSTCLDALAKADAVAFDKTGTLTEGRFGIVKSSSERALSLAACAEKLSSHPIAAAFDGVNTEFVAENGEEIAGRGIRCTVDGKILLCGNAAMLTDAGIEFKAEDSVSTLVYVAFDGEYIGVIAIDDKIKAEAAEAVKALYSSGVKKAVMLTGDSQERAKAVAAQIGLNGCEGGLLPDGKLEKATELKQGSTLLYVGDGINDAPVMTVADCAVSMGKVGSDAAIEASDVVLVTDNLMLLPKGKKIAKSTRRIVYENIILSLLLKAIIMGCSFIPGFHLIVAIFGDVGVMLLAVLNALRVHLVK